MKIVVNMGVSQSTGSHTFLLDDLGYTAEEWQSLTEEDKKSILEQEVFGLYEQPYFVLETFKEE